MEFLQKVYLPKDLRLAEEDEYYISVNQIAICVLGVISRRRDLILFILMV